MRLLRSNLSLEKSQKEKIRKLFPIAKSNRFYLSNILCLNLDVTYLVKLHVVPTSMKNFPGWGAERKLCSLIQEFEIAMSNLYNPTKKKKGKKGRL